MADNSNEKWYLKTSTLIIAILCIGPFALPLLWFNPRFSTTTKIIITVIVSVIFYFLTIAAVDAAKSIMGNYQEMYKQLSL